MSRAIAVLRPEPGNRVTAAAIEAAGRKAIRLPLFAVRPLDWEVPDPAGFDALVLTSANALRHGGEGLARLARLPVYAIGQATAEAAARLGFAVALTGDDGAGGLLELARSAGVRRALHLGGRERTIEAGGIVAEAIAVYASEALPVADATVLSGAVALVQSARAGARLAEIVPAAARGDIAIVAISQAAANAAGEGWEHCRIAPHPSSEALIEAARKLTD